MPSLRTKANEDAYQKFLSTMKDDYCPFCEKDLLVEEYKHWILVKNKFPYDEIAETHDLLALKLHKAEHSELTREEMLEAENIFEKISERYSYIALNVKKTRTVKDHFHFHLIKLKENNMSEDNKIIRFINQYWSNKRRTETISNLLLILLIATILLIVVRDAFAVTVTATVPANDINTCVDLLRREGYLK